MKEEKSILRTDCWIDNCRDRAGCGRQRWAPRSLREQREALHMGTQQHSNKACVILFPFTRPHSHVFISTSFNSLLSLTCHSSISRMQTRVGSVGKENYTEAQFYEMERMSSGMESGRKRRERKKDLLLELHTPLLPVLLILMLKCVGCLYKCELE